MSLYIPKMPEAIRIHNSKTIAGTGLKFSESASAHTATLLTNLEENPGVNLHPWTIESSLQDGSLKMKKITVS